MLNPIYNLEQIDFVGGESREFYFQVFSRNNTYYNAENCEVALSIINYSNKNGDPEVVKLATIQNNKAGIPCIAKIVLDPEDTVGSYGRYVYQISIKDTLTGEVEVPGQGILMIHRNIHPSFVN